jgi:hypothetical protein
MYACVYIKLYTTTFMHLCIALICTDDISMIACLMDV